MRRLRALTSSCGMWLLWAHLGVWLPAQSTSPTPQQILEKAVELHQSGDLEGAIRQYLAFLELHPRVADVRYNLGAAYASLKQYPEAVVQYREALQIGGLSRPEAVRFNLAYALFHSGEFGQAAQLLDRVLGAAPDHREALLLSAHCRLVLGDAGRVVELLAPLEAQLTTDPQVAYLLGSAWLELGWTEPAERVARALVRDRESAPGHLMLGTARLAAGDYLAALPELERALALDPRLPSLNRVLGRLLRILTRYSEADAAFRRELELNPHDFESLLSRGLYLFEQEQDFAAALGFFESALKVRPGHLQARFQTGLAQEALGRTEPALGIIEEVVSESPEFLEGHATLARLYYRLGRQEEAQRHRSIAERLGSLSNGRRLAQAGRLDEAAAIFERLRESDPSDPQAAFELGLIQSQMQDWPGAVSRFQEAVRLRPKELRFQVAHANALSRAGEGEAASAVLQSLGDQQLASLDAEQAWVLCDTYLRTGAHDQALELLAVLEKRQPLEPRLNLVRGQIYLAQEKYEQARDLLTRSLESAGPHQALGRALLGTALYQLGDKTGARQSFEAALELEPQNRDHLEKLVGVCLELGQGDQAVRHLRQVLERDPDDPRLHLTLADIYLAQGALPSAHSHLQSAETADPGSPRAARLLAEYWFRRGDQAQALDYALRARAGLAEDAELCNLLGNIHYASGRLSQAVEEYTAAVQLAPHRNDFRLNLEAARRALGSDHNNSN